MYGRCVPGDGAAVEYGCGVPGDGLVPCAGVEPYDGGRAGPPEWWDMPRA
ncbi:hypothetical protein GCM10009751_32660 [Myceligenerans crystallogenes]|uniref:Uncharacterized protein n=1 Tax=Myceligenerans crystallogenes TaxID=316335 RepID=A0ABP4ZWU1_9MICO